ncbi:MerR family transcriptional regulator [Macrococcus carouselicus]|nr:MerR family transcriptional regulator [Macrococcus carouselicus]
MPVFPISVVMKLTELSARQIRYYETHDLVTPQRTEGNQRLFSMNDLDRLLEIRLLLEKGFNIKAIKQMMLDTKDLSKDEKKLRETLYEDIFNPNGRIPLNRGDLSRFYK